MANLKKKNTDSLGPRRVMDPFDTMRANRLLAPTDPKLNDVRWLIGESLRHTHARARLYQLRSRDLSTIVVRDSAYSSRSHLPDSEVALNARNKLRHAEELVGPHAWPILRMIVIEGKGVRDCRHLVPELATPWRCDAVIADRLRCSLDMLGGLVGARMP